jgi:aspartate aminotransferase
MLDIVSVPGSQIIKVARAAASYPDADFVCFGESDLESPVTARNAAKLALDRGDTRYPDVRGLIQLRQALAQYLSALHARNVTESRIQLTASGMAAISITLSILARPEDRVLVHGPVWPNIVNAARLRRTKITQLALDALPQGGFRLDMQKLAAALPGHRLFILNSPNNPTGWTATSEELAAILALCRRHGVWLVSDEVYSRLVYDGRVAAPSLLDIARPDDRVIVCNSFSKTWAMTGWRLGWLVVPEGIRDTVADIVEVTHSGVAPFAQRGALAALADTDFVAHFIEHCAAGRRITVEALGGLQSVRYAAPDGSFFAFIGIDGVSNSFELALRLVREYGIAVAPGSAFGKAGEGFVRVCFALEPERLERAMSRLRTGLQEIAGPELADVADNATTSRVSARSM